MPKTDNEITLLTFSLRHGGAEKVCLTLCNEFSNRNYKTELWIVDNSESALTKELNGKISVYKLNKKHVRNSLFPLMKLLLKRKPKRLLIFHIELAILAIIIKRIFFLKTIIVVRSINTLSQAFNYPKGIWQKYIAKKAIRYILQYTNKIVAQSNGMKRDLIKNFHVPLNKVVTIHNPANLFSMNGAQKKNAYDKNEFLFIGRLNPQKGLTNLLHAFKLAHDQNPNIYLTIVGDGSEKQNLLSLVKELHLSENVSFEGFQLQTETYYARAKATLLTSYFEGFPNVLVESLSVGTPVISFNCPSGPEDIIEQEINGILVPHMDVKKFSEAILAVANKKIKFDTQKIISSSKKFSTDLIVKKYEQLLFDV